MSTTTFPSASAERHQRRLCSPLRSFSKFSSTTTYPLTARHQRRLCGPLRSFSRRRRRLTAIVVSDALSAELELFKQAEDVARVLKGVSVALVGENERVNVEVMQHLSLLLKYSPISVPDLIEKTTGSRREEMDEEEALRAENAMHEQLSQFLRVSLATCGAEGKGATARGDCWCWIFGYITVWLDDEESAKLVEKEPEKYPQREAYELADIRVVLKSKNKDFTMSEEEKEETAKAIFNGVKMLVDDDEHFPGKKSLYTRMGCRGDWPILQSPEWDGTAENFKQSPDE